MKILICGGRDFDDYEFLKEKTDYHVKIARETSGWQGVEIVAGGAKGADTLAEKYAEERHYGTSIFPAWWKENGKKAGFLRNIQMAEYLATSDDMQVFVIAFWDGVSKGTKHMIDTAKKHNLPLYIYKYKRGLNE